MRNRKEIKLRNQERKKVTFFYYLNLTLFIILGNLRSSVNNTYHADIVEVQRKRLQFEKSIFEAVNSINERSSFNSFGDRKMLKYHN